MSDTLPERPIFTSGQYIGASDLNAAVGYARDETERLALAGRTWGIATGLALVEIPTTTPNVVQMFIEPGIAWDGYGRPVVVLAPAPVTPDLFANLGSGPQTVWLRYSAVGTLAIAPGFQTCGAGDPATRVQETYAIEAGNETVAQRTDGVVIAGVTVADPRDMLIAVDQNAAVVLDGSAAHQSFPDDTGRWLIPVGIANYQAGTGAAPGSFQSRGTTMLQQSRTVRRYMSAVAESVLAADGVLRLRDRQTDNPTGLSDDTLDANASIQTADIGPDPNNPSRLIGNELVWVEGNMRILGNARLFGSQLELRDPQGQTGGNNLYVPEFLRRNVNPPNNTKGGQDLQIGIGSASGVPGLDRLTIGLAGTLSPPNAPSSMSPDGPLTELVVVRTDGRVAIGTNQIDNYSTLSNTLVLKTEADTGITVVSGPNTTGNLFFADGTTVPNAGFITYDHAQSQLELGAGGKQAMVVTASGQLVIGPATPGAFDPNADELIVSADGNAGMTIAAGKGDVAAIDFTDVTAATNSGYIQYRASDGHMAIGTASTTRVFIDQAGRVGIGTQSAVNYDADANQLVIASSGGTAGLTIVGGTAGRIDFAPGTGAPHAGFLRYDQQNSRIEIGTSAAATAQVAVDATGQLGVGTLSPTANVHIRNNSPVFMLDAATGPARLTLANNGAVMCEIVLDPITNQTALYGASGAAAWVAADGLLGVGNVATPRVTLDVRGPGNGTNNANLAGFAAVVENCSGGQSNVLALMVDADVAGAAAGSEFITFFDGTGQSVGAVELTINTSTGNSATFVPGPAAADFAEAVLRDAATPPIAPGSVVGVRNGVVSLATEAMNGLFVTTDRPAVLGSAPPKGQRAGHEMLSLLGQVPVRVAGPVQAGDLIVASGNADGVARAVAPDAIQPVDLPLIVGQAWDNLDAGKTGRVHALVGPGVASAGAVASLLARQAAEIDRERAEVETQRIEVQRRVTELEQRGAEIEQRMAAVEQQGMQLGQRVAQVETRETAVEQRATEIAQKATQLEQRATEIERRTTEIEQRATEVEQRTNEVERRATETEQRTTEVERRTTEIEQRASETSNGRPSSSDGRPRPSNGRPRSSNGRPKSSDGRPRPSNGRPRSSNGRARPSGGRPRSSNGRPRPSNGRPRSNSGRPTSRVERPRSSSGQSTSNVR